MIASLIFFLKKNQNKSTTSFKFFISYVKEQLLTLYNKKQTIKFIFEYINTVSRKTNGDSTNKRRAKGEFWKFILKWTARSAIFLMHFEMEPVLFFFFFFFECLWRFYWIFFYVFRNGSHFLNKISVWNMVEGISPF